MTGGAKKKLVAKKRTTIKKTAKVPVRQSVAKSREKVASRKAVKKLPQKINLKVNKIVTPVVKKKVVVKKQVKTNKIKDIQQKPISKEKKNNRKNKKSIGVLVKTQKTPLNISEGKIISQKSERDKQFLMWVGVSFFMILIIVFWVYSTTQNIKQASLKWQQTKNKTNWSQVTDEFTESIAEMKNNIKTIQSFASSSGETLDLGKEDSSIFRKSSSSSNNIDDKIIKNLKHDLEIKTGMSSPEEADYFFILEDEELKTLLLSLEKINLGNSLSQVKDVLGNPNFEQEIKDQRGVFVMKVLSYYVKILKENSVNEKYDKYISLEFNQDNSLIKINEFLD